MKVHFVFLSLFFAFSSYATTKNQSISGISSELSGQSLSIYIDENKILKEAPRLQKKGLIDANLSNAEMSFYKTQLAVTLSIPVAARLLEHLYSSMRHHEQTQVSAYLITTDLYGRNQTKTTCYRFNFNRQLYKQINWHNFQTSNLTRITPDFQVFNDCKELLGFP